MRRAGISTLLERAGQIDHITIGLMTASVVIGSSNVMTVQAGPSLFGLRLLTVLGLLGYLMGPLLADP